MAKLSQCNRCGHVNNEDDFEGMEIGIYFQGGRGQDKYLLCDPCVGALKKWISTTPSSAPNTSDDARDAARYRFMRGRLHSLTIRTGRLESNLTSYGLIETAEEADRYVDLAMSRSGPRKEAAP